MFQPHRLKSIERDGKMFMNGGNMGYPCHYPSNILDRINKTTKMTRIIGMFL